MTNTALPGWYVDPSNPTVEHWWDGAVYNGTRAAAGPGSAPLTPYPVQPGAAYGTVPNAGSVTALGTSAKSRTVASILGFFLGGLGVDRFYLGNIGMGVAKLLVGWLTLGIWPLIDWIIILAGGAHDGQGLPVTNWN
jgi:TM2 domain-containing membrane protein YozV